MTDAALAWTDSGLDLALEGGGLRVDEGLATAVLLSLFSDRRLEDASLLEGTDVRGWWGELAGDRYGSLLWALERAKTTTAALAEVIEAARESLAWLVEDGILEAVEVEASYPRMGYLELRVRLVRGRARARSREWAATEAYELPFGSGFLDLSTA